jgi:hypothetical protein
MKMRGKYNFAGSKSRVSTFGIMAYCDADANVVPAERSNAVQKDVRISVRFVRRKGGFCPGCVSVPRIRFRSVWRFGDSGWMDEGSRRRDG